LTREVKRTTTAETRTVDLSNDLVAALRHHLFWLKRETLQSGWGEAGWLFPTEANTPLDESRVRKVFHRPLGAAGLPRFRLYDLRHTFASLLLAEGAPITYVSAQLGHANPTTTLQHYARWIPSQGRQWINLVDSGTTNWNQTASATPEGTEVADSIGGPSRTRTLDPLIKRGSREQPEGAHDELSSREPE